MNVWQFVLLQEGIIILEFLLVWFVYRKVCDALGKDCPCLITKGDCYE